MGSTPATAPTLSKRPVELYLEVPAVDTFHAQVSSKGVSVTSP